jgi:hypothetical protein
LNSAWERRKDGDRKRVRRREEKRKRGKRKI